jgi:hypothetical protein
LGLVADRDRVQAIRAEEQAAESRAVAIACLAERAQQRLPGMGLEEQREVLALLDVRVIVLDQNAMPALRIQGELPGGTDLFPVTPSDLLGNGITGGDDAPQDPECEGPKPPRSWGTNPRHAAVQAGARRRRLMRSTSDRPHGRRSDNFTR